jgi:hypothetical protein
MAPSLVSESNQGTAYLLGLEEPGCPRILKNGTDGSQNGTETVGYVQVSPWRANPQSHRSAGDSLVAPKNGRGLPEQAGA